MAEQRSLFERIFGRRTQPTQMQSLKMLNTHVPTFSTLSDAYDSDVVRSAVDAIARNAAKLKPRHVRRVNGQIIKTDSNIEYLLSVRPNPYMDAYSMLYKTVTQLYMQNNAFIFIDWDERGQAKAFYPLNASQVEFLEADSGIFVRFMFFGGQQVVLPYEDIIHIRRFFYKNDIYGESSTRALMPALELINTTNEGIINAVKSSATIRGLLKFSAMLKPEEIKRLRNEFVQNYLDITNNGGVAATDTRAEYVPLSNDPKLIDSRQMELIEDKIYKYYNVSASIVKSDYTEEQWSSFYESVIEPIAVQLSLEFTAKVFTRQEQVRGNEILFEANRLQYASNDTKIKLIEVLMDRGILSKNQAREIFNMAPVESGDDYIVSLNYVNTKIADEYQLGKNGGSTNDNTNADSTRSGIPADIGIPTVTSGTN